jgi:type IV pilus assembly protein PilB
MTIDDRLEELVVARATGTEMRQAALAAGMVSLREDGWNKVTQGLTTIEEVLRVSI